MQSLRDLINGMTDRTMQNRPRGSMVLEHEWFSSDSDAPLPESCRLGLVGKAAQRDAQDAVIQRLAKTHNLDELRALQYDFARSDKRGSGKVPAVMAKELLTGHIPKPELQALLEAFATDA